MCSGCSDYFEGDDEMREPDDGQGVEEQQRMAGGLVREQDPSFCAGCKHSPHPFWQDGGGPVLRDTPDEDYEVLVSGEYIIERRTIRAKCHDFNAKEPQEPVNEGRPVKKSGTLEGAKHYQTHLSFGAERGSARRLRRKRLILWCLGAALAIAAIWWIVTT
jgi:hypothetical protein